MRFHAIIFFLLIAFAANSVVVAESYCGQHTGSDPMMEEGMAHENMHGSADHASTKGNCSGCCEAEHNGCANHGCSAHCTVYLTSLHNFILTEFKESLTPLALHKPFPDVYARLLRPPRHV